VYVDALLLKKQTLQSAFENTLENESRVLEMAEMMLE